MNYRKLINKGTSLLKKILFSTPAIDAELLLSISLNQSREEILLKFRTSN